MAKILAEIRADAKAVLAETERRNAETGAALARLKDVARASDVKLQDQVDAIKARLAIMMSGGGVETGGPDGGVGSGPGVGNGAIAYASEADLVALRDWAREVATGHDARLRRVEGFGLGSGGQNTPTSAPPLRGMSPYMSPRPPKAPGYPGY